MENTFSSTNIYLLHDFNKEVDWRLNDDLLYIYKMRHKISPSANPYSITETIIKFISSLRNKKKTFKEIIKWVRYLKRILRNGINRRHERIGQIIEYWDEVESEVHGTHRSQLYKEYKINQGIRPNLLNAFVKSRIPQHLKAQTAHQYYIQRSTNYCKTLSSYMKKMKEMKKKYNELIPQCPFYSWGNEKVTRNWSRLVVLKLQLLIMISHPPIFSLDLSRSVISSLVNIALPETNPISPRLISSSTTSPPYKANDNSSQERMSILGRPRSRSSSFSSSLHLSSVSLSPTLPNLSQSDDLIFPESKSPLQRVTRLSPTLDSIPEKRLTPIPNRQNSITTFNEEQRRISISNIELNSVRHMPARHFSKSSGRDGSKGPLRSSSSSNIEESLNNIKVIDGFSSLVSGAPVRLLNSKPLSSRRRSSVDISHNIELLSTVKDSLQK